MPLDNTCLSLSNPILSLRRNPFSRSLLHEANVTEAIVDPTADPAPALGSGSDSAPTGEDKGDQTHE